MRLRKTAAILAAVLVVVSAVGAATGMAVSKPRKAHTSAAPSTRSYEARFAAFARTIKATDKLPPQAQGTIPDGAARHYQVDWQDTRMLAATPPGLGPGSAVYVARGASGSCVIVSDAGGSSGGCSDTANFLDGDAPPIALLADGTGAWNVIAVLPNGARNVTATSRAGASSLSLSGNVATGHFTDAPTWVTWTLADGTTHAHAFPDVAATPGTK